MSLASLQTLVKNNDISGISIPSHVIAQEATHTCEVCVMAKHNRAPFNLTREKPTKPMMIVSSDIARPYEVETLSGGCFVVTFVDWCTTFTDTAVVKAKSDAFNELKRMIIRWEAFHKTHLEILYTDREVANISTESSKHGSMHGGHDTSSPPRTHQNATESLNA